MAGNLEVARNLGVLEIEVCLNFIDSKLVSEFPDCVTLQVLKNGTKTPVRLLSVLRRKKDREAYFGMDDYAMTKVRLIEGACVELFSALDSKGKGVIKDRISEFIRGERLNGTEKLIVHLDEITPVGDLNFNYNIVTSGKGSKIYRSDTPQGGDWTMPGENSDYPKLRVGFGAKKKPDNLYGYSNTTTYSYATVNIDNGMKFKAVEVPAPPPVAVNDNPWAWNEENQDNVGKLIADAKAKLKAEKEAAVKLGKAVPGGFFFDPALKGPIKAEPVPVPPQKAHAKPIPDNEIWMDDEDVEF